ncbi:cupin domain-containing protein [Desulfitobacterium sp.]|uniref:cupin domain-containing protein n=1 Tax=Desulfitobacterium sp. TaxID=49981 RepID=UPI002D02145F|nr:cupin domain-containing protein [Desulfitobacterium sp.]HVJ50519.1 cupin domain-containing protein [Desulfitobacterium sp.]
MEIGNILKQLRERKGLTLRELGEKAGLSASFIGQVEREETSPSIRSLKNLTDALEVNLIDLFSGIDQGEELPHIVTPEKRRKIESNEVGIERYLLTSLFNRNIEMILIIAQPGSSTGEGYYSHDGEETGFIISGSLVTEINGKSYFLREGDSISFKCSDLHRWENTGIHTSVSIWAITPPSF